MHQPVLDALRWLQTHKDSNQQYYYLSNNIPIDSVVRPVYHKIVIEADDKGRRRMNERLSITT